jgi:hypothetical protein
MASRTALSDEIDPDQPFDHIQTGRSKNQVALRQSN